MDVKPGWRTTEFWVAALSNVALAVLAILAARGLVSEQEAELWLALVQAILVAAAPIGMALISMGYSNSRAKVKSNGK